MKAFMLLTSERRKGEGEKKEFENKAGGQKREIDRRNKRPTFSL